LVESSWSIASIRKPIKEDKKPKEAIKHKASKSKGVEVQTSFHLRGRLEVMHKMGHKDNKILNLKHAMVVVVICHLVLVIVWAMNDFSLSFFT
jgi:hypothetical protein|tara:strand:- start:145 stop:423 length:279 start_codon:yes stop_codon:yes gene_type:complete